MNIDSVVKGVWENHKRRGITDTGILRRETVRDVMRINKSFGDKYPIHMIASKINSMDHHDLFLEGIKQFGITFPKEVASSGLGVISAARGVMDFANFLKDVPAYAVNGVRAIRDDGSGRSYLERAGAMMDKYREYVPDGWKPEYLDHYIPALSNDRWLTPDEIALKKALRENADDAAASLATMGVTKALGAGNLLKASIAETMLDPITYVGGTAIRYNYLKELENAKNISPERRAALEEYIKHVRKEQARLAKVQALDKKRKDTPWYHHAALGYGAGGVTGGVAGYAIADMLKANKTTKIMSALSGGAVGAVLGRYIQQKMLKK